MASCAFPYASTAAAGMAGFPVPGTAMVPGGGGAGSFVRTFARSGIVTRTL